MSNEITTTNTSLIRSLALGIFGSFIVALVVLSFVWPTKSMEAQNIPIAVVGSSEEISAFSDAVEEKSPGLFDIQEVTNKDESIVLIEQRETYGAVIFNGRGTAPEFLVASAANVAVATLITGLAQETQNQLRAQIQSMGGNPDSVSVDVTNVVPLNDSDATGAGLLSASFPIALGGLLAGILTTVLVSGIIRRIIAVIVFAFSASLLLTVILHSWFEFIGTDFVTTAVAFGMSILASGMFIIGCTSLLGMPGIAVGSVITLLVANPLSAASIPWQFLLEPWGFVGQNMVPGASNWLFRTITYFPSAETAYQWNVLITWSLIGLSMALLGYFLKEFHQKNKYENVNIGE